MPSLSSFRKGNISGTRINVDMMRIFPHVLSSKKLLAIFHASYCNSVPAQPTVLYQTIMCKKLTQKKITFCLHKKIMLHPRPCVMFLLLISIYHSGASTSRPLPPASSFRHPVSQSSTGAFRTGLSPLIPVPDCFRYWHFRSLRYRTDPMPDSPAFIKTRYKCEKG